MREDPKTCEHCGRPVLYPQRPTRGTAHHVVSAHVVHGYYGCDTGCCGHRVIGVDCKGVKVFDEFDFSHPWSDEKETWARSFADKHLPGVPLDFAKCEITTDC